MSTATERQAGRGPRRSTLLLAASVAVGVVLVLWGADRLARWAAETVLARNIQIATGVFDRPEVDVHGTFFLLQVISGRYERVEIVLGDLRAGPLRIERIRADLTGVHVPFHDVLTQDVDIVHIEQTRQVATLRYDDLNTYLDATGRALRIDGAPDGEVLLTGSVEVLGRRLSASARAVVDAEGGDLAVQPTQVDTRTFLDGASRLLLRQRFTVVVPMDPLPFGQTLTDVETGEDHVTVEARGSGIVLTP
ncbi:LmeA family phospholipid-binding protein [Blastococcus sp. SYSU DS1024]